MFAAPSPLSCLIRLISYSFPNFLVSKADDPKTDDEHDQGPEPKRREGRQEKREGLQVPKSQIAREHGRRRGARVGARARV